MGLSPVFVNTTNSPVFVNTTAFFSVCQHAHSLSLPVGSVVLTNTGNVVVLTNTGNAVVLTNTGNAVVLTNTGECVMLTNTQLINTRECVVLNCVCQHHISSAFVNTILPWCLSTPRTPRCFVNTTYHDMINLCATLIRA